MPAATATVRGGSSGDGGDGDGGDGDSGDGDGGDGDGGDGDAGDGDGGMKKEDARSEMCASRRSRSILMNIDGDAISSMSPTKIEL